MCCTGKCPYEDWKGDCRASSTELTMNCYLAEDDEEVEADYEYDPEVYCYDRKYIYRNEEM